MLEIRLYMTRIRNFMINYTIQKFNIFNLAKQASRFWKILILLKFNFKTRSGRRQLMGLSSDIERPQTFHFIFYAHFKVDEMNSLSKHFIGEWRYRSVEKTDIIPSFPIGAWKCNYPPRLGNYSRQTKRPTAGQSECTVSLIGQFFERRIAA